MKQVRRDSSQVCSVQGTPRSDTTRTVNTRSEVVKGRQNRPCFHHFMVSARVEGRLHGESWISGESKGSGRNIKGST